MPVSTRGTVIIVEDDPSMSQALKRILRLGGFDSRLYPTGEALLDEDRARPSICMIFDVQLPGVNGFVLRDRLASLGTLPPVIFITAFDEPDARAHAAQAGAAAFLVKPFAGRLLLETVRRAVEGSSSGGASPQRLVRPQSDED